ncbi:LacI family transcriptional regulator [Bifidobacterium sp. UTCIF-37]|nr:LacI family transcriptional regulator [Bifidobacterium sp. UTCIF-37]TPF87119.1 LacI family transcriptional regulator [Bifidobacterium sp. UTCIF-38]
MSIRMGEKQPTIFDVAAEAGVSKSVVSRVLRGIDGVSKESADRVSAAMRKLGYVPSAMARGMASSRTKMLGLIVRDCRLPFYGILQNAVQKRAHELGYQLICISGVDDLSADDLKAAFRDLLSLRVEGIIVCSAKLTSADFAPYANRVPIVVAGHEETSRTVPSVFTDEEDGAGRLSQYLCDYGHRDVAVFIAPQNRSLSQNRRGLAMAHHLEMLGATAKTLPMEGNTIGQLIEEALSSPRITAYMCPSDVTMLQVMEELRRRGLLVPRDISVTGYDGFPPLSASLLGLSTYRQPLEEIGSRAVDIVYGQLQNGVRETSAIAVKGVLVSGRTVALPRFVA